MPAKTTTDRASLITIDSTNNGNGIGAASLPNQDSVTINHGSKNILKDNGVHLTISGNSATQWHSVNRCDTLNCKIIQN